MKATIDRIEGSIAVLIVHGDDPLRVNVPVLLLPPGCREGDILTLDIERDPLATESEKKCVADRIERLKNKK
ncbi:MAG: DUF3006 domain-containing protein [Methanoregula sp.]|jgi:hypothetical protein